MSEPTFEEAQTELEQIVLRLERGDVDLDELTKLWERGEEIYNFQGVRRYKDKYDPVWQPRYIAAANKWAISLSLIDVSLLSAGGMTGLAKRPKRAPAPVAAGEPEAAQI